MSGVFGWRRINTAQIDAGAFAVRCPVTGSVWVGSSRNLDAAKNRLWFMLGHGSHPDKTLQEEWNVHGETAFRCEILEVVKDEPHPLAVADLLKQTRTEWAAKLAARILPGQARSVTRIRTG